MKSLILAAAVLATGLAQASTPNYFQCKGNGVEVSYSTTGKTGQPQLAYQVAGASKVVLGQSYIRSASTPMGNLVTVTVQAIPDFQTSLLSVVIPNINFLGNGAEKANFESVVIETTARTSIAGPKLVKGVVETAKYHPVSCTASRVMF